MIHSDILVKTWCIFYNSVRSIADLSTQSSHLTELYIEKLVE